ncbi:MAG TPA: hypothetical protein VK787_01970 [Puia sp.]|jgi:hypothetical protein|nr:hypothetical protein [Puia sp.]
MRKIIWCVVIVCIAVSATAQELYVSTEPASNMATGSIGIRFNSKLYDMKYKSGYALRLDPEIMFGVSKKIMIHLNAYASNMYQQNVRFEGASVYVKYRFYSNDDVHSHFRMAAFGKISLINNPTELQIGNKFYGSDEIDIDGNNSGALTGIVATQLLHKLALSSSVYFLDRFDNLNDSKIPGQSDKAMNYTLSAGYLLLPKKYTNFRQTNFNLYCEFLSSTSLDKKAYYIDAAPAVQFIFNSISRLDLSYRWQLTGSMERLSEKYFLLRFEYNLLNVFKKG